MELFKVADALVYLGVIQEPEDAQHLSSVTFNFVEGEVHVHPLPFTVEIEGVEFEPPEEVTELPPQPRPLDEDPDVETMTLEEATREVERRTHLREL